MRISGTCILAMTLLAISSAASANAAETSSSTSMTSSRTGSSSEASFTGNDGRHVVNGDVIEIRQGRLTVNGVPHGTIKPSSIIRYSVQDRQKTLMVDGQSRPLHK